MKNYSLSLWAWALNEEELVEEFVYESIEHLKKVSTDYEIILVDDGSTDKTWSIMQQLDKKIPELTIIKHPKNMRPGHSMRSCLQKTTKEIVFWNTVDSFFDSSKLGEWLEALEDCDMVQGIRSDLAANTPYRKLTHLVNYWMIRILYAINLREFQNVKFCYADFLRRVKLESGSTFTNPECAIKAYWSGLTIKEKSMEFLHRKAGKAKGANPIGILESFRDILYFWVKWHILRQLPKPIKKGKIIKLDGRAKPEAVSSAP